MKKVLIIGYVWPEPGSSAAGSRMLQLIQFFQAQSFTVTFSTTAAETEVMADLSALRVNKVKIALNNSSFDGFLKELQPDIVMFDRFMMEEQFGWRVRENCPAALRILDTEDLHFYRRARQQAVEKCIELEDAQLFTELAYREIASIYRCDLSLIISRAEFQLLTDRFQVPGFLLLYLPFMEQQLSEEHKRQLPGFEARKDFVSIGNFRHAPNWDAVLVLKTKIWPLIRRRLPGALLHVYGAYAGPKVHNLHNAREGFLVEGRASAALEALGSHRVLLAPLRFGAGLKGKFIDAMKAGTPSVTTPVGAEGMGSDTWPGLVVEDPEGFARGAVALYEQKEDWEAMQTKGFRLLEERFSFEEFSGSFKAVLDGLTSDLATHRAKNFTGSLLHHHQMSSTKYLSKYIEAKNRLEEEVRKKNRPENSGRSYPNK